MQHLITQSPRAGNPVPVLHIALQYPEPPIIRHAYNMRPAVGQCSPFLSKAPGASRNTYSRLSAQILGPRRFPLRSEE